MLRVRTPAVLHRIQFQMVLVVMVIALPVLGWSVYITTVAREQAYEAARAGLEQSVTVVTSSVASVLSESKGPLQIMASAPEVAGDDRDTCSGYLRHNLANLHNFDQIGVADAAGMVWCGTLAPVKPTNVSDRSYFVRAMETGAFAVGDYQTGRVTGGPSINVAVPLYNSRSEFDGVLFAAINLDHLTGHVLEQTLPAGLTVSLVGCEGKVALRYPDPDNLVGKSLPEQSYLATAGSGLPSGLSTVSDVDGSKAMMVFRIVPGIDPRSAPYVVASVPNDEVLADANNRYRSGLALTVGTVVLAAVAGLYIAQTSFIRPALALLDASTRIAAGEKGVTSGIANRRGEFGQLAHAFDDMASQLDARVAEYESLLQELDTRVQERTEKLEQADAAKDALLAAVSHELKNQLTGIRTFAYVLNKHADRFEERDRGCIQAISRAGAHMLALISDLTDFAAIDQGALRVDLETRDLRPLIEEAANSVLPLLEEKQQTLELNIGDAALVARADDVRIQQVIVNLLSNASKYSLEGAQVFLEAGIEGDRIIIKVRDQGFGMSAEDQRRLFQPFYRVRNEKTSEIKGTGLGLAICKALVEAHQGTIAVQSSADEGSTFTVMLPRDEADAP